MIDLTIDVSDQLENALPHVQRRIYAELSKGVNRAALEVANVEKQEAPKAFSTLTNSINVIRTNELTRMVGPSALYAEDVVKGREPGGKPVKAENLVDWVIEKKLTSSKYNTPMKIANAIGLSIAKKGIAPNDFVGRTVEATEDRVKSIIQASLQRALLQAGVA